MFYSMMSFLCTIMPYSDIVEMAKHILKAQEIHENSWNGVKGYTLKEIDCVKMAVSESGNIKSNPYIVFVSHIITFTWNDSMDWANSVIEEDKKMNINFEQDS